MGDEFFFSRNAPPPNETNIGAGFNGAPNAQDSMKTAAPNVPAGTQPQPAQMTMQQPMSSPAPPPKK